MPTYIIVYVIIIIAIFAYQWYDKRTRLSEVERQQYGDIITLFFEDPNRDDFEEVWAAREKLIGGIGRSVKFWIWGVHLTHPEFFTDEQRAELATYSRDIERGLRKVTIRPTAEMLDCMWALYFATGDTQYVQIVKNIAEHSRDTTLSSAARWSYESVMNESPWANDTTTPTEDTIAEAVTTTDD